MNKINITATLKSPRVIFDPENYLFEMEGVSRPENVRDFYYPIIDTLREYFENLVEKKLNDSFNENVMKFNFKLDYFNSSSAKFIADILVIVKNFAEAGFNIKIYWYFEESDEDMKDVGEDFSDMISHPFNFVMIQR
ncbi:MAG: DUF1987 domain-containing protein [Bacteroidales bacterium]|nr:DUF1987 domain-containing protein [Bacteroidales bacterium]